MRGDELLDKMEFVAPAYIEEADEEPKGAPVFAKEPKKKLQKKHYTWKTWAVLAACLLLVVGGALSVAATNGRLFTAPRQDWVGENGITFTEAGVTIPEGIVPETSINAGMMAHIGSILIYESRYYELYQYVYVKEGDELLGEYLGTPQKLVYDEEPAEDGLYYKSGLLGKEVYTVKGYDPAFMLCTKRENDVKNRIDLYICCTGMTLKYGSELFEDRLHLSEYCVSMQYRETRIMESGYVNQAHKDTYQLPATNKKVKAFLKELNEAEVLPWDMVEEQEELVAPYSPLYFSDNTRVQFQMKDGTTVLLAVDDKGYVRFLGMPFVCVKLSEKGLESLLKITEEKDAVIVAE